jgi:arylsulfatase B
LCCRPDYSGAEEHFTHKKAGEGQTHFDLANSTGAMGAVLPCRGSVGPPLGDSAYSAWLYGNETIRLLQRYHGRGIVNARPFFAYIAWNNVHDPCECPEIYTVPLAGKTSRPKFVGMMQALDDSMIAVVDTIKELDMWQNTVFIFTTDNGGNLGGQGNNWPLRGGKFTVRSSCCCAFLVA